MAVPIYVAPALTIYSNICPASVVQAQLFVAKYCEQNQVKNLSFSFFSFPMIFLSPS